MKIGETITLKDEIRTRSSISGYNKTYPKGTRAVVTASGKLMMSDGNIISVPGNEMTNGYDTEMIAQRIMNGLKRDTDIEDMIDNEDEFANKDYFICIIRDALDILNL